MRPFPALAVAGDRDGIAVGERAAAAFASHVALRAHGDFDLRGFYGERGLAAVHHLIGAGHHATVLPAVPCPAWFRGWCRRLRSMPEPSSTSFQPGAVVHLPLIAHRALRRHGEAGRRALYGRSAGRLGGHRQLCAAGEEGLHRAGQRFRRDCRCLRCRPATPACPLIPEMPCVAGRGEAAGAHGQLERALALLHEAAAQVNGHGADVHVCGDFQHRWCSSRYSYYSCSKTDNREES